MLRQQCFMRDRRLFSTSKDKPQELDKGKQRRQMGIPAVSTVFTLSKLSQTSPAMGTCFPTSSLSTLTRLRRLLLGRRSSAVKCASAMTVDIPKGNTHSSCLATASTEFEQKTAEMSHTTDSSQKDTEEEVSLKEHSSAESMDEDHSVQEVLVKVKKHGIGPIPVMHPDNFHFLMTLGEGSYSTVYLCKDAAQPESIPRYAIKVISKAHVVRHDMVLQLCREMRVMEYLNFEHGGYQFISKTFAVFQDPEYIYVAMNVAERGDFSQLMKGGKKFDLETAQFYAAEIIAALDYIHKFGITHRDLKPENILLTMDGHILLTDFGSCAIHDPKLSRLDMNVRMHPPRPPKLEDFEPLGEEEEEEDEPMERQRRSTFVGTPQYVSPEMLRGDKVGPECDLWAFACILYQMLAGYLPFKAINDYHLMKRISSIEFHLPEGFDENAADLVRNLLTRLPEERLTTAQIKAHPFFKGVDWQNITAKQPPSAYTFIEPKYDRSNEPAYFATMPTGYSSEIAARVIDKQLRRDAEEFKQIFLEPVYAIPPCNSALGFSQPIAMGAFDFSDDIEAPDDCVGSEAMQRLMKKTREQRILKERLKRQEETNQYNQFCNGKLIIKQGLVDKKKGMFARTRMFVLTEGPRLFYVRPENMEFKGEVPFSPHMSCEVRDFRMFYIHTPRRVYYLFDPESRALDWCKAIMETKRKYETQLQIQWDEAVKRGIWPAVDIDKKKLRSAEKERLKEVKKQAKLKALEEKKARKAEKNSKK